MYVLALPAGRVYSFVKQREGSVTWRLQLAWKMTSNPKDANLGNP
jgi:hypothetical protein